MHGNVESCLDSFKEELRKLLMSFDFIQSCLDMPKPGKCRLMDYETGRERMDADSVWRQIDTISRIMGITSQEAPKLYAEIWEKLKKAGHIRSSWEWDTAQVA
jgi:hypothetical protein